MRGALLAVCCAGFGGAGCEDKTIQAFPEKWSGVGVELTIKENLPEVVRVIEGGPADEVGLHRGDRILEIEGISTEGLPLASVVDRLRGPTGSAVKVLVREASGGTVRLQIVRRDLKLRAAAK